MAQDDETLISRIALVIQADGVKHGRALGSFITQNTDSDFIDGMKSIGDLLPSGSQRWDGYNRAATIGALEFARNLDFYRSIRRLERSQNFGRALTEEEFAILKNEEEEGFVEGLAQYGIRVDSVGTISPIRVDRYPLEELALAINESIGEIVENNRELPFQTGIDGIEYIVSTNPDQFFYFSDGTQMRVGEVILRMLLGLSFDMEVVTTTPTGEVLDIPSGPAMTSTAIPNAPISTPTAITNDPVSTPVDLPQCDETKIGSEFDDVFDFPDNASGIWCITDPGGDDLISLFGLTSEVRINLGASGAQYITTDLIIVLNGTFERVLGARNAPNIIIGNDENNSLQGGSFEDLILGMGGDDNIQGGNGNDIIEGGDGDDFLMGENGDDEIYGDRGNDSLRGGSGNDLMDGGAGDDDFNGRSGRDVFIGGEGIDKTGFSPKFSDGDIVCPDIEEERYMTDAFNGPECDDIVANPLSTPAQIPSATPTLVSTSTPTQSPIATISAPTIEYSDYRLRAPGVGDICQIPESITLEGVDFSPGFAGDANFGPSSGWLFFGSRFEYWLATPGTQATFIFNNAPEDVVPSLYREWGAGDGGGFLDYLGNKTESNNTLIFTFVEEDIDYYNEYNYGGEHFPGFSVGLIFLPNELSEAQASEITLTVYCGNPDDGIVRETTTNTVSIMNCLGLLPSRMNIDELGQVIPGPGLKNRIRSEPTINSTSLGFIEESEIFTVLDGPTCQDGYAWWQVNFKGTIGWTVEGDLEDYWIEPLGSIEADESDIPATENCVIQASNTVNLRNGPGTSFDTIGQLSSGASREVIGQATSTAGFIWWQLEGNEWIRSDIVSKSGDCSDLNVID